MILQNMILQNFNPVQWLRDVIAGKNDPVRVCEVYKTTGCVHVDGMLCNLSTCEERHQHAENCLQQSHSNN